MTNNETTVLVVVAAVCGAVTALKIACDFFLAVFRMDEELLFPKDKGDEWEETP